MYPGFPSRLEKVCPRESPRLHPVVTGQCDSSRSATLGLVGLYSRLHHIYHIDDTYDSRQTFPTLMMNPQEIRELYLKEVAKGDVGQLNKLKLRIEDPPRRKHMVFLGGSVLADIMKAKDAFWMSREEYNEKGLQEVLKKCF